MSHVSKEDDPITPIKHHYFERPSPIETDQYISIDEATTEDRSCENAKWEP